MPAAVNKKYIFAFVCMVGTASVLSAWLKKPEPEPLKFLPSVFATKGLGDKVLQVKIRHDDVSTNSEESEIVAEVSMPFDFNSRLNYRWKIGEGVEILQGELSGFVDGLQAKDSKLVRLKVRGFSRQENHHIGFEIYGKSNGRAIYGDALSASDLENTFENTVQNVERIKASQ